MPDPTEPVRRALLPTMEQELKAAVARGERTWTAKELAEDYEVLGFQAPFVVARRKSDKELGTLMFTHYPRFYFGWAPDVPL